MLTKTKRLTVAALTVALLMCLLTSAAYAVSDVDPQLVAVGSAGISANGTTLSVTADTQSIKTEDEISVTATLQVKNGSSWRNVYTWPTATKTNASYVSLSGSRTGVTGETYRLRATHYTRTGTTTDSRISYSSEVTVH